MIIPMSLLKRRGEVGECYKERVKPERQKSKAWLVG